MSLSNQSHIVHHTFVSERTWSASPERVFAAFSDREQKRLWYFQGSESFEMDFRIGGAERAVSRLGADSPFPGVPLTSEGIHLDIAANQRVVIASCMSIGGRPMSASLCTFQFLPEGTGTCLVFTHQGAFYENSDGPAMREEGWNTILNRLDAVVNAA
jgi:uncharacterized protein YndB with AHSA1/START domain